MCPRETIMNAKDRQTMDAHGISCATKNVYFYKEYKYDRLEDAVRYAEIDARRARKAAGDS
jgi:hypothetical protein